MASSASLKLIISIIFISNYAQAFCGFFVAKAGTQLFNKASKVVMVRDEDKTVLTMANDYQGDLKEFAMVIPVPEVLQKGQIHVTENKIIEHLDAYTAPRLVEYFDHDPCQVRMMKRMVTVESFSMQKDSATQKAKNLELKLKPVIQSVSMTFLYSQLSKVMV